MLSFAARWNGEHVLLRLDVLQLVWAGDRVFCGKHLLCGEYVFFSCLVLCVHVLQLGGRAADGR
jgi:hypothetical protein